MSELFAIYEYNLNLVIKKLTKFIENMPSVPKGKKFLSNLDKYDSVVSDAEINFKEAEGIV